MVGKHKVMLKYSKSFIRGSCLSLQTAFPKSNCLTPSQSRDLYITDVENLLWLILQFWNTDRNEDEKFIIQKAYHEIYNVFMLLIQIYTFFLFVFFDRALTAPGYFGHK